MITAAKYGSIGEKTRACLISLLSLVLLGFACHAQAQEGAITSSLSLSQEEAEWLAAHPVIRLGIDSNYGPYSFVDENGQLQGAVRDFLTHIERTLNLRFEIIANLNWPQLMEAVQQHRIDAVATVVHLPEREAFLEFSRIYLPTPLVIMTRKDARQMRSLDELPALRMALVEGYSSSKQLIALYPAIRPSYVTTPLDGLRAVASGMADAYVGVLGVNAFLASQHGIANLKVNAAFDMEDNGQRFGVRKDWPQLARLLDKALAAIPAKHRADIWQHWIPIHADEIHRLSRPTLASRLFPWLLGLIALSVVGYLVVLLWNRQLKRELTRWQKELAASTDRLRTAETIAHVGNWQYRVADGDIQWSDESYRIFGLAPHSLHITYDWLMAHIHPDDRAWHDAYLKSMLESQQGEDIPEGRYRLVRSSGEERSIRVLVQIEYDAAGKPSILFGIIQDISDQVRANLRIAALNRLYQVLSDINEAIVRLRDPQAMLNEVCRIAVEVGGFRMAWLGMADAENGIKPLAHAGIVGQYLENLHISLGDDEHGRGPTGAALRAGQHMVSNDIANDPHMAPWRETALELGYRASAAFPIKVGGQVRGAFNLYSDSAGFFSEEELRLLDKLAQDIAFAMEFSEADHARETLNRRMLNMLESMSDGFVSLDRNWCYQYVNHKAGEMLGRTPSELIGKNIWEEFPEGINQPFHLSYQRAMNEGVMVHLDEYYPHWDLWFENRIYPTQDGISIFFTDITERKRAKAALQESETRLRLFIEHAPAALAMFDHEMHYLAVSHRWLTDYSLECGNILGRSHYEIFPEISERWKTIHRRGLAGEVVQASEDRFERANGTVQWLRWEMRPWHAADGAVGGIVIFSEDITERKLAGLALLESEARYRSLLEMAPFPAVLSRLRDGILLYGNHRAEIQYGISREQGIGQPADRFYKDPEQRNHFIELLRKDGRVDDLEVLMAAMDGHLFWALVSASIVDFEGEPAIFAAINDISARKYMEDEIRQLNTELEERVNLRTAELAAANKELETFTYSVSHDLKAPLRGIDGYSRLLQEQYQSQLDEEGRLFLNNVRLGVEQMDALIEDLLAYSRMERRSLTGQSVNLARLVTDILDERRTDIDARGMIVEIQGLQELTARADPEGLAMVLRNLLDNALKFTRDSHPPTLTIRGTSAEKSVILELHDNGIGFDMQFHDRIFDIFQRLLRAEDYPGTGVGLAIVRKAMQRMGGRVWAESAPGQGATFNLEIPR